MSFPLTIPDFQSLMLPVLQSCAREEAKISDVVQKLGDLFALTADERASLVPSGTQTTISNRANWAKSYLGKAGLIELTGRGRFKITAIGILVLAKGLSRIDKKYLMQFPAFTAIRVDASNPDEIVEADIPARSPAMATMTPDEIMRSAHRQLENELARDLLDRILSAAPDFFERLVVKLLTAMGYGGSTAEAARALGRTGDGGVDGVIDQDALGLDRIYVQAKRYGPGNSVGAGDIRDFFGSLDRFKAAKGLFVTTSTFSKAAKDTAELLSKRIVLIDGTALAKYMIRYSVGCRVEDTLVLKRVDEEFFE